MSLSLESLQLLVAAADSGSFSAAARRLGKAQSAVSTGIANLEIDLGLTLFDRSGRLPRLTAPGERMVAEARALLAQQGQLLGKGLDCALGLGRLAGGIRHAHSRAAVAVVQLDLGLGLQNLQRGVERVPHVEVFAGVAQIGWAQALGIEHALQGFHGLGNGIGRWNRWFICLEIPESRYRFNGEIKGTAGKFAVMDTLLNKIGRFGRDSEGLTVCVV